MFIKKLIRFRILLIVSFIGCLVLFPSLLSEYFETRANAQSTKLPTAYVGVWKGEGVQNSSTKWSILMALTPGDGNSVVGTMAYPSLACGGELNLRGVSTKSIELAENLTHIGRCINRGTVFLQPISSERLQYKWLSSDGKQDATGSVQKVK